MGEVQDTRDAKKAFVAPAIKSFEHYDFPRAKICCSLTWLVAKAYGTGKIRAARGETTCMMRECHVISLTHACPSLGFILLTSSSSAIKVVIESFMV